MSKLSQITPAGLAKLKQQLEQVEEKLTKVQRLDRGTTTSWGGSFEKERLQNEMYLLTEQKREIEEQLANVTVVEEAGKADHIAMGVTAKLLINKEEVTYTFVSAPEADPSKDLVSIDSPIGKELSGKKEGAVATVATPAGEIKITVMEIV